ncbi:hypothetical protein IE53DRAFT_389527 [Violaceomyces palustris]|uniref:Uncharacterized protein n=1 Tax=Violaceomyces palustris TaxID=1673888 RepID=A0ACD0NR47_9BASI|nr:hypothetical protein IE53DRAFT_389527 [Violaceomyces palustris]
MSSSSANPSSTFKPKSKAYSSQIAIQSDAAKYRHKYKELKRKVREIEMENDKLHLKTLRIKRNIQRMRLERAILYERLEADTAGYRSGGHHYDLGAPSHQIPSASRYDPYPPPPPSHGPSGGSRVGASYHTRPSSSHPHSPAAAETYPTTSSRVGPRHSYGYDHHHNHHHPQQPLSRPHSPPPPQPSGGASRGSGLRQYTPSASPEIPRENGGGSSSSNGKAGGGDPAMKVTLKRGGGGGHDRSSGGW